MPLAQILTSVYYLFSLKIPFYNQNLNSQPQIPQTGMIQTNFDLFCNFPFLPFSYGQYLLPNNYSPLPSNSPPQESVPSTTQNIGSHSTIPNPPPAHRQESKSPENIDGERRNPVNPEQSKKNYKKNMRCPAHPCKKKYSSRIALRSHMRKVHPHWAEQTSDYQP